HDAQLYFLPNPNVGVLNAKYLIESFALPYMSNSSAFIEQFHLYSLTVCASIGTVRRAMDHLTKMLKITD
ncbi:MAG: hypothetical protein WAN86_19255, partial [Hyphomicrobiaceae bacterium]